MKKLEILEEFSMKTSVSSINSEKNYQKLFSEVSSNKNLFGALDILIYLYVFKHIFIYIFLFKKKKLYF